ncbi:PqqD family peptide modification chaperone [Sphingomonas sp. 28-63-12]|uniref:PqqD family peptide modification chaperone n=1 Tax=Sphingomonas sp. 28-63-12 TaxID=1970434 RepID=UPI000BCB2FCC|nr:MAG: hypothetical protein B7Y47_06045 [Sphingomonas sp. 28-63-12]
MIHRQGDWVAARVGDEMVMMSVSNGQYLGLNMVGACIWDMLETPKSIDAIEAQLLTQFDVSAETCRAEVAAFIEKLAAQQAIAIDQQ